MSKSLLIIIPAYNEQASIVDVVSSIPLELTVSGEKYRTDVVVVDDCSRDDTYKQARKTRATVLRHIMNSGAGAATRTGFRYAIQTGPPDYIITIDADGQHAVSDIEKLLKAGVKSKADMIVGNRLHAGNKKHMPLHRTLGNKGLSLISRILFGIKTEDTQSGLRLVKGASIEKISNYSIDRYGFCTEMLWLAYRNGLQVREEPIAVSYSKETLAKGQNNWGVIDLIMDLVWIRMMR